MQLGERLHYILLRMQSHQLNPNAHKYISMVSLMALIKKDLVDIFHAIDAYIVYRNVSGFLIPLPSCPRQAQTPYK